MPIDYAAGAGYGDAGPSSIAAVVSHSLLLLRHVGSCVRAAMRMCHTRKSPTGAAPSEGDKLPRRQPGTWAPPG
jgi:hypothetical protein